jgi:hypothetical protein
MAWETHFLPALQRLHAVPPLTSKHERGHDNDSAPDPRPRRAQNPPTTPPR